MSDTRPNNQLAGETSPYLLQHADNPVAWYPWCQEALERARREEKPILLSVGYSACHWCHVMAHESFEDDATAQVMNELFVNIKVDREERPDLDRIYQTAHQLLAQRPGGWPLTMFLTHDRQIPFFGGTYFPREPRHGMPAFVDVLQRVANYYRERQEEIGRQSASILDVFARLDPSPTGDVTLDRSPLEAARSALESEFDARHGGFGRAPKFPHPSSIERLLAHWRTSAGGGAPDLQAKQMALFTLECMARGGIYDQLGGGFCRYSVDDYWMIPHFEKMLYDNGPLLALYAQAWALTGDELFRRVAGETADWVMREMQSPEGGYYSSLDADSEGEEGKFYAWERDEVRELLSEQDYRVFARRFGLEGSPNFEGRWHLHVQEETESIVSELGISRESAEGSLQRARATLFEARAERTRPGRDDKVLTSWNGLMIRGMAVAARHLGKPELAESATRAVDFLRQVSWRDGRLQATYKDGRAHLDAYLDDYAFLADGLLELLQARWRSGDLAFADALAAAMLEHFEDREAGGFYFTADDHEQLIHRPKGFADEALPAGNAVAARVLGRLGHLLGRPEYLAAAERCVKASWDSLQRYPQAHGSMLSALEEQLQPIEIVIVRADPEALGPWLAAIRACASPCLAFGIPPDAADLPEALAQRAAREHPIAYVCRGTQCSAPLSDIEALKRELAG